MTDASQTPRPTYPNGQFNLVAYFTTLARYWIVGVVVMLLVGAGGFYLLQGSQSYATYSAKSQIVAIPKTPQTEAEAIFAQTNQDRILRSYQNMALSHAILDPVIAQLGSDYTYDTLATQLVFTYTGTSLTMSYQITNMPTQEDATTIIDLATTSFIANVAKATGFDDMALAPKLQVIEQARPMLASELGTPTSVPSPRKRAVTSAALGVVAGIVAMAAAHIIVGRRRKTA